MKLKLDSLKDTHQLLFAVRLKPVQGRRFQPTGFPDLGAATYQTPEGTSLLVESAQSMANRMEAVCWDDSKHALVLALEGLSYVRVNEPGGGYLTSSVEEAHRLNSVYIERANRGDFHKALAGEIGYSEKEPIDRKRFVETVFKYDAGSLVHGVFLESIGGRLRIARALTAFIEADGVAVAASGGVKNDHVQPGKGEEGKQAGQGYGNVPFHRDEYTAHAITLYANLDLAQIRGYGLRDDATRLLTLLSLYKLRALLDGKLRLRSGCDLDVDADKISSTNITGFELPSMTDLEEDLRAEIAACKHMFAGEAGVTKVEYKG